MTHRPVADAEKEEEEVRNLDFIDRHFSYDYAWGKRLFLDALVGGIFPGLLLISDPGAFRSGNLCFGSQSPLASFLVFVYLAAAQGVPVFLTWIVFRKWLPGAITALFAGVFVAGTLFAIGLGIGMVSLTNPGAFVLLGALSAIPLWVAYIYFRHAIFAFRRAREKGTHLVVLIVLMLIGGVGVLARPAMAQMQATAIIEARVNAVVADPGPETIEASAEALRSLSKRCPRVCNEMLVSYVWETYYKHQDQAESLADLVYKVRLQGIYLYDCSAV